jgi:hypothetical protein
VIDHAASLDQVTDVQNRCGFSTERVNTRRSADVELQRFSGALGVAEPEKSRKKSASAPAILSSSLIWSPQCHPAVVAERFSSGEMDFGWRVSAKRLSFGSTGRIEVTLELRVWALASQEHGHDASVASP